MGQFLKTLFSKMPTIGWIIIPLGIALVIGSVILGFWALATVEGVASVLMLLVGTIVMRLTVNPDFREKLNQIAENDNKSVIMKKNLGMAIAVVMGVAVDQTGNFIYNKPMQ